MSFQKIRTQIASYRLTMRMKFTLGLCSVVLILLVSGIISILEYSRMSNYISTLISDNIKSINVAQQLSNAANDYNLEMLAVIGEDGSARMPDFNQKEFVKHCDKLRDGLRGYDLGHLADSVMYSYSAYMLTSMELPKVWDSNFVDNRTWYFDRLQPVFQRLMSDLDKLNAVTYNQLKTNSATFESGFYRSIIPGVVAVAVGILLVLLLLYFVMVYYINPIYKMLSGIEFYRADNNRRYTYELESDDELASLNENVGEIINENIQLRRRVKELRALLEKKTDDE